MMAFVFPFSDITNNEMIDLFNNGFSSLKHLDNMCYENFILTNNDDWNNDDPDSFLLSSLHLKKPDCNYYFADDSLHSVSQAGNDKLSVISLNINSIPCNFNNFRLLYRWNCIFIL